MGGWSFPVVVCGVYRVVAGRVVEYCGYIDDPPPQQPGSGTSSRVGVARLVAEQAALRRVATLVARGAGQAEVFDAIVSEAAELLGQEAWLWRFEPDDTATCVAQHGISVARELTGGTHRIAGTALERVRQSGRPTLVRYGELTGSGSELMRREGVVAGAAAPLVVQGVVWGTLGVMSDAPLAAGIEDRLAQFAELAATAIANAQSRAELELLADEQAALLRVAELVTRGAATREVFEQVTVEAHHLLNTATGMLRYDPSGAEGVVVAQCAAEVRVGLRVPVEGDHPTAQVWRAGRAVRFDDFQAVAAGVAPRWVKAAVHAPIVVEGRLWGLLAAGATSPLPAGSEERLARFCELVAAAIANAESRAELAASRARVVAEADEARRRLARDVHDGAQRQLVHALLFGKQARAALAEPDGPAAGLLEQSLSHSQGAYDDLRRLAHGILPAALEQGGLKTAVEALAADAPLLVRCEVLAERLPDAVETTAYFVIAEALTNVIKHADARSARVRATCAQDQLTVQIADDGRGGAGPSGGSGLVGLADRVGAAAGTITVTSPPAGGTTIEAVLPLASPTEATEDQQRSG